MISLSFISTLYNSEPYLRKCVDSMLHQNLATSEYEIILINDGSPDNSLAIAQEYAATYPNIRVISHENKGLAGARNTGLRAACGKYIRFVDPDDYLPENCCRSLLRQMEDENLDILRLNYSLVNERYEKLPKHPSELAADYSSQILSGDSFLEKKMGTACYVWAFMFKLSLIMNNDVRFYEGEYFDDVPWTPRVIRSANRINSTAGVCYYYLQRADSLVRNKSMINKKIEGLKFSISELSKQRETASAQAKQWYDKMLTQSALSLLCCTCRYQTRLTNSTIEFLKRKKLRILCTKKMHWKAKRKVIIYNISPYLFSYYFKLFNR